MRQLAHPTKRQQFIADTVGVLGKTSTKTLFEHVRERFDQASRITVIRDLNALVAKKLLKRTGKGRAVSYELSSPLLLRPIDAKVYFEEETDKRVLQKMKIDFAKKNLWRHMVTEKEEKSLRQLTELYRKHLKGYRANTLQKELERITIEFSWRSSHLEGNTYSLLDTERLMKEKEEAEGKKHEEALMILNHKSALEYIWKYASYFRKLSPKKIEEIHTLIIKNLGVTKGLRKHPTGIIGTLYKPYDNVYQIRESLEDLCRLVNSISDPFVKTIIAILGISYLQPFEDGNKRTSRLIGNALLVAHRYCPLSYRSVDETEYKKAVILFYEQHSLSLFKKLLIEQYEFAVKNYFL